MDDEYDWEFVEDPPEQGSSDGFWYDLVHGGYIKPEEVLACPTQVEEIWDAVRLLESFRQAMEDEGILREM